MPATHGDHHAHGQEGEAGHQRAEAQHDLHEERQEEEHAEDRAGEHEHDPVGPGPVAVGEHVQRGDRLRRAALVEDEQGQQGHGGAEGGEREGVGPPFLGGADEPVDERDHAQGGQQRAREVEVPGVALGLVDDLHCHDGYQHGDRDVDEEHPAPVEPFDEDAPREQPDRAAAG